MLDSLLGSHRSAKAPSTPQEALAPSHPQVSTLEHPLVGALAPLTPPPGPTLDEQQYASQALLDLVVLKVDRLAGLVEVLSELQRTQREGDAPIYDGIRLSTSKVYRLALMGRTFSRLWVASSCTITARVPGLAPVQLGLVPGWNALDVPEKTELAMQSPQADQDAIICLSQQPMYVEPYQSGAAVLADWSYAAQAASINETAVIDVARYSQLVLLVNVTAISGTTPTLTPVIRYLDSNGVLDSGHSPSAINSTGVTTFGLGPAGGTFLGVPTRLKLAWTIAGTGPSVTWTATLIGRRN
jgi:hypothetical protein